MLEVEVWEIGEEKSSIERWVDGSSHRLRFLVVISTCADNLWIIDMVGGLGGII
jgi:hypothetical protein